MIKKNKAQGLPMSTIVIAIILLIVMIVIIVIFTGQMDTSREGLNDCESKGSTCETKGECKNKGGTTMPFLKCPDEDNECCKIIS